MNKITSTALKTLLTLTCSLSAAFAFPQAGTSRIGLSVSIPNGYPTINMVDMHLASSAGEVRWSRTWNGKEWKFNPQWESLSQSWTNLTGGTTGTPTADAGASATLAADASAGCWVMVDEDWKPSQGTVLIDERPPFPLMLSERTAPFNKLMGEEEQNDYPPPRIVNVDYANLCKGIPMVNSPVRDLEAVRIKNALYLGEGGRYSYSNRTVLEKTSVRGLPSVQAAAAESLLAAGSIALAPVTLDKGYRWMDRAGEWIDYNVQGQVVSYGDKNGNTVWLLRDTAGTLRGVLDHQGRVLFSLHYTGKLITEVRDYPIAGMGLDMPGRSVKYQYDAGNRLRSVTDVMGNQTSYDYDSGNHLIYVADQENRITKLEYAGSSVKKRIAPDGGVTDYAFDYDDVNKQFTSRVSGPETQAGRKVEELTHDRSGQLVRRVINGVVDEEVRRDTGARTEIRTNARGFSRSLATNEFGQPVQLVQEDGTVVKQTFSPVNLTLLQRVNATGVKVKYEYDGKGNLIRATEAAGTGSERTIEYQVDSGGNLLRSVMKGRIEANGRATSDAASTNEYDERGQVTKVTSPEQAETRLVHDRAGNLVSITDARGNATAIRVNLRGQVVQVTDPMGHVWTYEYDKVGNAAAATEPNKSRSIFLFDVGDRLAEQSVGAVSKTSTRYDAADSLISTVDGDGRTLNIEYDNFQRVTKYTDGAGNATSLQYQIPDGTAGGKLGSLRSPTEISYPTYAERLRYDAMERPTLKLIMDRDHPDRQRAMAYDANGLVTKNTNPYGKSETLDYDAMSNMTGFVDELGKKTGLVYDVRGNVLEVTDARGKIRRFEYDRSNRVVKETLPGGQSTRTAYDAVGNVSEVIDATGNKKTFEYDAANRMTKGTYSNSAGVVQRSITYTWDAVSKLTGWRSDEKGSLTSGAIEYDGAKRRAAETIVYAGGYSMRYEYSYSKAGKKTQIKWPDGTLINFGYSPQGELNRVSIPGEGEISLNQFQWNAPGRVTLPGGTVQERNYDGVMNPITLSVTSPTNVSLLSLTNKFGAAGEQVEAGQSDSNGSTTIESYRYDDKIRLTAVGRNNGAGTVSRTYGLDEVDNRVADSQLGGNWIYDDNNRLTSRGTGAAAVSYEYDSVGNLVRKTESGNRVTHYEYDASNHMVAVRDGQQNLVARYGYDPMGRRVVKEQFRAPDGSVLTAARRTYFLHADEGIVAEAEQAIALNGDGSVSANGEPVITTQYGLRPDSPFMTDLLFLRTRNSNGQSTVGYFHNDHRGAPVQATDRLGNIIWAARYDAFGRAVIVTPEAFPESPTINVNVRLPGQIEDEETGLHYNFYRYYDPETGRYTQADPLGLDGGVNGYAYVNGSPLSLIDPYGLFGWADMPSIPQPVVDFAAGFGDTVSFGLSKGIRNLAGIDGGVDLCSTSYSAGGWAGMAASAGSMGAHAGRHAANMASKRAPGMLAGLGKFFRDSRTYGSVQKTWSGNVGGYAGKYDLHHWFTPQSFGGTSAGWNLLPVTPAFNRAMSNGGALFWGFKISVIGLYGGVISGAAQKATDDCTCEAP